MHVIDVIITAISNVFEKIHHCRNERKKKLLENVTRSRYDEKKNARPHRNISPSESSEMRENVLDEIYLITGTKL